MNKGAFLNAHSIASTSATLTSEFLSFAERVTSHVIHRRVLINFDNKGLHGPALDEVRGLM